MRCMMDLYEGPRRAELDEYTDMINGYPKHVVSATLEVAGWNNSTIIRENFAEEVSGLKRRSGKDILVFGSAALTLMRHDLVDELRLMTFPIVVGSGK